MGFVLTQKEERSLLNCHLCFRQHISSSTTVGLEQHLQPLQNKGALAWLGRHHQPAYEQHPQAWREP